MATDVWPIKLQYPLKHSLKRVVLVQNLGDGHEQRVSKSQAWGPRADGTGNLSSYKGINVFGVNAQNMLFTSGDMTKRANIFWQFYQNHDTAAFYFYNPAENNGDPSTYPLNTGVDQIGRYLVRFQDPQLDRELILRMLYNSQVTLIEVRA